MLRCLLFMQHCVQNDECWKWMVSRGKHMLNSHLRYDREIIRNALCDKTGKFHIKYDFCFGKINLCTVNSHLLLRRYRTE